MDLKKIYERFLNVNKKMIMTAEDLIAYEKATHCHICEGVLGKDRVRDHSHLTGKFRGAAHGQCSFQSSSVIYLDMMHISLLRISVHHPKEKLDVYLLMMKSIFPSQKIL